VLKRINEAISEQNMLRAHLEVHSLKSMALYIGAQHVALSAQLLQDAAIAGNVAAARASHVTVRREFAELEGWVRSKHGGASLVVTDGVASSQMLIRHTIEQALAAILDAAKRGDVRVLGDEAQMLKQMTVCHGPMFDLLAIASYKLQQASRSGNLPLAIAQVPSVVRAFEHLQHQPHDDDTEQSGAPKQQPTTSWSGWLQGSGMQYSLFSHVIQVALARLCGQRAALVARLFAQRVARPAGRQPQPPQAARGRGGRARAAHRAGAGGAGRADGAAAPQAEPAAIRSRADAAHAELVEQEGPRVCAVRAKVRLRLRYR